VQFNQLLLGKRFPVCCSRGGQKGQRGAVITQAAAPVKHQLGSPSTTISDLGAYASRVKQHCCRLTLEVYVDGDNTWCFFKLGFDRSPAAHSMHVQAAKDHHRLAWTGCQGWRLGWLLTGLFYEAIKEAHNWLAVLLADCGLQASPSACLSCLPLPASNGGSCQRQA
jgi:hypothetical protein